MARQPTQQSLPLTCGHLHGRSRDIGAVRHHASFQETLFLLPAAAGLWKARRGEEELMSSGGRWGTLPWRYCSVDAPDLASPGSAAGRDAGLLWPRVHGAHAQKHSAARSQDILVQCSFVACSVHALPSHAGVSGREFGVCPVLGAVERALARTPGGSQGQKR